MKVLKIDIKKFILVLIEKGLFTLFLIFLISIIFGVIVSFKYAIRFPTFEKAKKEKIEFEERVFEEVLEKWQEREKKFQEVDFKEYPNPFK